MYISLLEVVPNLALAAWSWGVTMGACGVLTDCSDDLPQPRRTFMFVSMCLNGAALIFTTILAISHLNLKQNVIRQSASKVLPL